MSTDRACEKCGAEYDVRHGRCPSCPMSDEDIRDDLKCIDEDEDITVGSWEADFIESVLYRYKGRLSEKQRQKAKEIIEKYLGDQ
jgi:hypothetical protein